MGWLATVVRVVGPAVGDGIYFGAVVVAAVAQSSYYSSSGVWGVEMAGAVRMPELTGTDTRSSPYPSASHSVSQSVCCLLSVRLSVRLFDRSNPQSVCRLPGSLSQPARLSAPPVVSPLSVSRSASQSFVALLPKSSSCQSIVVCPSVLSAWFSVIRRRIGPFRPVACIPVSQSATRSICRTVGCPLSSALGVYQPVV